MPESNRVGKGCNPCDSCQRPIADCPWLHSRGKEPVKGWVAVKVPFICQSGWTYHIFSCPLYVYPKGRSIEKSREQILADAQGAKTEAGRRKSLRTACRALWQLGMSDREIANALGIKRVNTVGDWRRTDGRAPNYPRTKEAR